jgi:hypothetical protein
MFRDGGTQQTGPEPAFATPTLPVEWGKDVPMSEETDNIEARPTPEDVYPVLPLRDIVVFPHMIVPLFVGREKSIRALETVMRSDKQICWPRRRMPAMTIRNRRDL